MKALNYKKIKQEELKLLQTSGFSLAESVNRSSALRELLIFIQVPEVERLKVNRVRNMGVSSNANLQSFSLILLTSIYSSSHLKQDLLDMLKSFLYHPQLNLTSLKHSPLPQVSSQQMKKVIVEFFYSLTYSNYEDKIQSKLCKYPIIMDILVIFLRCLLIHLNVANADDYQLKLPTKETIQILINFFDLNCNFANLMFLLYEDKLFIHENKSGQIMIGSYLQNEGQRNDKKNMFQLEDLQQQIEQDTENDNSRRQSFSSHARSLEFRGIVSESLVFQHQAPTPFFNFLHSNKPSVAISQQNQVNRNSQKLKSQTFMKQSMEMKILKQKDLAMHQSQTNLGFGNMKRTMLQYQLKQSLQSKGKDIGSPLTLDSSNTLYSAGNFGKKGEDNKIQTIRTMKKSKSEDGRHQTSNIQNSEELPNIISMKKKQKIQYAKSKIINQICHCKILKKQSMKIHSNLYEINMRYVVPSNDNNSHKLITGKYKGEYYINTKGLNCELYAPASNNSIQYIRQTYINQKKKPNLNVSVNSCYVIPHKDSQTYSKRQLSPISNNEVRSFSPFGSLNTSPKITFSYKNPLKYSYQHTMNKNTIKK